MKRFLPLALISMGFLAASCHKDAPQEPVTPAAVSPTADLDPAPTPSPAPAPVKKHKKHKHKKKPAPAAASCATDALKKAYEDGRQEGLKEAKEAPAVPAAK